MNSKDNKNDEIFDDHLTQDEEGKPAFEQLLTAKKIVQRRDLKVEFTTQLPPVISAASKKILPPKKKESTVKKIVPTIREEAKPVSQATTTNQERSPKNSIPQKEESTAKKIAPTNRVEAKPINQIATTNQEISPQNNIQQKVSTAKKIVPTQPTETEQISQPSSKPIDVSEKVTPPTKGGFRGYTQMPTFSTDKLGAEETPLVSDVGIEQPRLNNKIDNRIEATNPPPKGGGGGYTQMPTFSTDKLGAEETHLVSDVGIEQPPINNKMDNRIEATNPPPVKVPPIRSTADKPIIIENDIYAEINGGSTTQHVTDSPYSEAPVEVQGKNLVPRSQEVDDILSYVPSWMVRWGNTVILLIIGGILLMSYYIKYPDVVSGVVTISAAYPPVPLVAKATGAVTLFKEDQEKITEDEVIGVIKNTANYNHVLRLKKSLADLQVKMEKGYNLSYYELPKRLKLGELQSTFSHLFIKLEEKKVQNQTSTKNITRKQNIGNQLKELAAIKKAKGQSLSIKYQAYLKAKTLLEDRYNVLFKKGSISAEQLNKKESEVRNLLDIYQNDRMSFNEINKRILDLNSNKEELDFEKEDQEMLKQSSLITAFEELRTAITSWENRYLLKSPITGTLSYITLMKNNMYLQQEQNVANIIPIVNQEDTTAAMIGELVIPSLGSGKAAIGQIVNIELNDYPKKQYGVIEGVVESIGGVSMDIPDGKGMTGYKVMVSFPNGLENTMKKEIAFKHNMQGQAEIITEDIRLIERFFHELREVVDAN